MITVKLRKARTIPAEWLEVSGEDLYAILNAFCPHCGWRNLHVARGKVTCKHCDAVGVLKNVSSET